MTSLSTSFPSCTATSRTSRATKLQPPPKHGPALTSHLPLLQFPLSPVLFIKCFSVDFLLCWGIRDVFGVTWGFCPGLVPFSSGPFFFYRKESVQQTKSWKELLKSLTTDFYIFFFQSRGSHRESCCGAMPKVESTDSRRWDGDVHLRIAVTN